MADTANGRFWAKVLKGADDDCWEWAASVNHWGYGHFRRNRQTTTTAHRFAFESVCGPIPSGRVVMHSCDNRRCCNPAHLSVGTIQDNMDDRNAKGRQARGSRHSSAKLVEADIPKIRRRLATGHAPPVIAADFGVSQCAIADIRAGRTWTHV